MKRAAIATALLALLTSACAEYGVSKNDLDSGGQAPREDNPVSDYLRVDVYPSDQNPDLLPETHILDGDWEGLSLSMSTPATYAGMVWGYDASPYFDISVPGSFIPIEAMVSVYKAGTIMSASAHTDAMEDGAFRLRLPRADDYTLAVLPVEPTQLPLLITQGVSIRSDVSDELIELDYGAPVYGRIANGTGLELGALELELWLRDPVTGSVGPKVSPDDAGYYQLRAMPGHSYQVVLAGDTGELVPTTRQDVVVESDEGAEVNFQIGAFESVGVSGQGVTAANSSAVEGATVRFTSLELYDFPDGELILDDITSSRGEYRLAVLPGRYMVEFIAPASMGLSPAQVILAASHDGDGDDFDVQLEGLYTIESQVLGPGGQALAGVTVVATERGFDGYTYTATSDEGGYFRIDVPMVKLQFLLNPPEGQASVTYIEAPVEDFPSIIMLERGDTIQGSILHKDDPVAFAIVEVRDSEDQLYATTVSDDNGEFQVRVRWEGAGGEVGLPLDTGLGR